MNRCRGGAPSFTTFFVDLVRALLPRCLGHALIDPMVLIKFGQVGGAQGAARPTRWENFNGHHKIR